MKIRFVLNASETAADIEPGDLLVDVVRACGSTGTKEGCGVGVCGACTVLVDEAPISSCIYLAACVDGREVWTVEGLAARDPALIEAFVACEAMQCGICTPGQVVAAYAGARAHPGADEDEIREFMSGNLCRCTGYATIIGAVAQYLGDR